jgi:antirestriction protein ArdC
MATQDNIRERVTNEILRALEKGVIPWQKPWNRATNVGLPTNVASKRRYSGVNPLLLDLTALERGFQSKWWGTFNQWKSLGGCVKKRPADVPQGQWGTKIIFYKSITRVEQDANGNEKETTFPMLREFVVFNAEQVEGVEGFGVEVSTVQAVPDFEPAEEVIRATGADIRHVAGDKACYHRPPSDCITMPLKGQFAQGLASYYATAFHELAHWTESRLNWTGAYALGELRAEMAAAFLGAEIDLPNGENLSSNHAAYLSHWIGAMKEDHKIIFRIASAASSAADFILSFSQVHQEEEDGSDDITA